MLMHLCIVCQCICVSFVSVFVYCIEVYLCITELPDDQLPTFQGDLIT